VDSDLFDSRLNLHGFGVGGSYSIRDNIAANLLFAMGDRIKKDLFTGGGGDVAANPLNDYRILQLDLTWKF
jgi:hypothetical protein